MWHSDQTWRRRIRTVCCCCPVRCQWTHKSLCTKCTVAVFVVYLVCSSLLTAVCKSFFFSFSIPACSRFLTSYWKHFHSARTLWRISDYQPRGHWNTGASRRLELRCSKSLSLEHHVEGGSRRTNVLFRIEIAMFFLSPKHQRLPCPSQRRQTTFSSITSRSTCNTWGHVQVFQSVHHSWLVSGRRRCSSNQHLLTRPSGLRYLHLRSLANDPKLLSTGESGDVDWQVKSRPLTDWFSVGSDWLRSDPSLFVLHLWIWTWRCCINQTVLNSSIWPWPL